MNNDKQHIERMIEAYFDCTLSEQEESELRMLLANTKETSEKIDEAKAVMWLFKNAPSPALSTRKGGIYLRLAACILALFTLTFAFTLLDSSSDVCVMYAQGMEISDADKVLAQMNTELTAVAVADNNLDVALFGELSDMAEALNSVEIIEN